MQTSRVARTFALSLVAAAAPAAGACGAERDTPTSVAESNLNEVATALHLANTLSVETLTDEVGLARTTALALVGMRTGPDGRVGTADDVAFTTMDQLRAVPYFGEAAERQLLAYAAAYEATASDPWRRDLPVGKISVDAVGTHLLMNTGEAAQVSDFPALLECTIAGSNPGTITASCHGPLNVRGCDLIGGMKVCSAPASVDGTFSVVVAAVGPDGTFRGRVEGDSLRGTSEIEGQVIVENGTITGVRLDRLHLVHICRMKTCNGRVAHEIELVEHEALLGTGPDKHLITNAEYAACYAAAKCPASPRVYALGYSGDYEFNSMMYDELMSNPAEPVIASYQVAWSYCERWAKKSARLKARKFGYVFWCK
jgi:hypothetical protein